MKLFSKLKENNETYENENKIKIPSCNCNDKYISNYEKKIKLNGPCSTYLLINITWSEQFPSMLEILSCFGLIPISEPIGNLFTFGEELKQKINDVYYIKSIILYGIYHYICIIYLKEQKKWAVIDDKTIKYIYKYYDLIDSLLRNHLMPVGLIYSKDRNDEISENEIKSISLNKDEYIKLYQFCKDIDLRRGLKVSDLIISKNSYNENNENYFNNNYFFNSVNESEKNDNFKNNTPINENNNEKCFNPKTYIKPNRIINIDNNSDNNLNIVNIDNNVEQNKQDYKIEISKGRKIMGNFNDNNMKGGLLVLSTSSMNENENNEKSGQTKEETDKFELGKNYDD